MRWSFQLVCRSGAESAAVSFGRAGRRLDLRLEFRGLAAALVVGVPGRSPVNYPVGEVVAQPFPRQLFVSLTRRPGGEVMVRWQGCLLAVDRPTWSDLPTLDVWDEGIVIWHERPGAPADHWASWRLQRRSSGFRADPPELECAAPDLARGLSFIIRAKNEADNIGRCLRSIGGLADEIVFVDNGSTDGTRQQAEAEKASIFELKTFSYPWALPKVGAPHAAALRSGSRRTLGHFYNWCLAQSSRRNFIKWDADYIAISKNLAEMIARYDLRLRGDHFVLWFSGLELFTDGRSYWVDTASSHSEFRVFSRAHGHRWVDIPIWEEIDQAALFMSQKLFFWKPVYVELFRLDEIEFNDRGVFLGDPRDRARLGYVREFRRSGSVPASFLPIAGPFDKRLADLPLSAQEVKLAMLADRRFRAAPALSRHKPPQRLAFEVMRQFDFAVFIASSLRNRDRRRQVRSSWGRDLRQLGIPFYFVVGRPGQPSCLIDDILYLDVPDSYEFGSARLCESVAFSIEFMNIDFVFKVEDDCVLNAFNLMRCSYQDAHFTAGGFLVEDGGEARPCRNRRIVESSRARTGTPSVDGKLGYFLSRQARILIGRHVDLARRAFLDGPGITTALAAADVKPAVPFGQFTARRWPERGDVFADDVLVLAEVPADCAVGAYRRLVGPDAYGRARTASESEIAVDYDWSDLGRTPEHR